jgi:hypothetical protein
VSTADRHSDGYEPRFDIDAEIGRQGELFVLDIIEGLKNKSIEVKTDVRSQDTGNLYIEYECLRRGEWRPSGIATTESQLMAFVIGGSLLVVPTQIIKRVARSELHKGHVKAQTRGSHPTKGVIVPLCLLMLEVRKGTV